MIQDSLDQALRKYQEEENYRCDLSFIVMHPSDWAKLGKEIIPDNWHKHFIPKSPEKIMFCVYKGVRVIRSEDVEIGEFLIK